MTTLDLPEINEALLRNATAPVVIKAPAVPATLKATVLAQFDAIRPEIHALAARFEKVAYAVDTPKGFAAAKAARLELRESGRYMLQRTEKRIKDEANELKAVVTAEVAGLIGVLEPVEDAIDGQIKAEEVRRAAEKAEAERIEAERIAKHQAGIATIRAYLTRCQAADMTSERVANGIAALMGMEFSAAEWQEFAVPAASAQCETIEAMRTLQAQLLGREQEAARLELQRQEQARMQAELEAERQRIAAELAEVRRQAAELAAQRAESERLDKLAEAKRIEREETAALAASIRAESRRVEWPKNPAYIRKAMGTFECMAPDWQDDPREEVRAAIAEGRQYLAGLLIAAATEAQADIYITTGVRAEPIGAPSDEYADADPDAATRAPAEPAPETVDRDDALTAMEQEPAKPAGQYLPVSEPAIPPPAEAPTFEDECRGLLEHIELAFAGKFSTQPKPSRDWWQALRAGATNLKGMLP